MRAHIHSHNLVNNLPQAVKYLLSKGADHSAKTNDGKTPVDVAHQCVPSAVADKKMAAW